MSRNLSQHAFVKRIRSLNPGIRFSQPYLSMIERGERQPAPDLARVLSKATNGEVTTAELLEDPETDLSNVA